MLVDEIQLLTGLRHKGLRSTLQTVASSRGKAEQKQGISQLKRLVGAGVWKRATENVRQRCQTHNTVQSVDKLHKRQHASLSDADAAPVTSLDQAPEKKARCISKPSTKRIPSRRIKCKKCKKFSKYSSAGSVKVNINTGHETTSIRATCEVCTHPNKGGNLTHECWLVEDKPTADESLFHVQPEYYSVNHCVYVVDPANLATIPNASLGSMNQGELWPTGIQATPGTPAVVAGVYCTHTMVRGITHSARPITRLL